MNQLANKCFFLILFFAFFSCNNKPLEQKEIDFLEQQIMETHDEVMPKIGKVLDLRKRVNLKLDSCLNKDCKENLQKVSYQLTKADADMMNWMHQYQKPLLSDTAIVYLKNQQVKIEQVKVQILSSIIAADSVLRN